MKDGEVLSERYRVICRIGRGGTSTVYKVEDRVLHKKWALKIFFANEQYGEIFEREIRLLCCLNHPGLPRVVDVIRTREGQGIVMDLLEGETLDHQKGPRGYPFSENQVLRWGCQICDILDYLHRQDPPIIYGDLKPANLLLRPDGSIMLLDLGISRSMITPFYAAPEQLSKNQPLTPQTDLYGLGKTLYVLLNRRNGTEKTPVDELLRHLTNPEPSKRGKSAAEVRSAIQQILSGQSAERQQNTFFKKWNPRRGNSSPDNVGFGKKWRLSFPRITMLLALIISTSVIGVVHIKNINHFHQKQKNNAKAVQTGSDESIHETSSDDAADAKTHSKERKSEAFRKEITAILNVPSEQRDYKAFAACLSKWRQILEDRDDEAGRATPGERYRRAKEERQCAEYYLTYEEELESKAQVPRTEAEGLLLDAEKRLDEVDTDRSNLSSDTVSQEKSAVLSLLLNLYQRSNRTEQALQTVNQLLTWKKSAESRNVRQNPEYSQKELHLVRLNLLLDLDRHDEARQELNFLIKQYPQYLKSYLSMISYDYRTGRLDEAVSIYQLAEKNGDVAQNPDFQVMRTKLHNAGAM